MKDYVEEIGDVLYDYGVGLYANITNRCPCRCDFCIRTMTSGLGSADSLWLKREPTPEEVIEMLSDWDLSRYQELVFCGYGEPMVRLDDLLVIARYVKENTHLKVRINTNGLGDLLQGKPTAPLLAGVIDAVSHSCLSCQVHYNIKVILGKQTVHQGFVGNAPPHKDMLHGGILCDSLDEPQTILF